MKKTLMLASAVAVSFTMASCMKSEFVNNEQITTLTVKLPEVVTKAGEGSLVNTLYYEVYTHDGVKIADNKTEIIGQAELSLNLMHNAEYKVLLWAQAEGDTKETTAPYNAEDLKNVAMNYNLTRDTPGAGNDELRDAFTNCVTIHVGKDQNKTITLKRPFAQLNFVAFDYNTTADFDVDKFGELTLISSLIEIENVGATFNVETGYANSNNSTAVHPYFSSNNIVDLNNDNACDLLTINKAQTSNIEGVEYPNYHISMNYILLPIVEDTKMPVAKLNVRAEFVAAYAYEKDCKVEYCGQHTQFFKKDTGDYVPVDAKQNYKTNIRGFIFTKADVYTVTTAPDFEGEYTPEY